MQAQFETAHPNLATKLRSATAIAHQQAEGARFVKRLFQGHIEPQEYYHYLWALHQIYDALETAMSINETHEALSLIDFEELKRVRSLEADLKIWDEYKTEIPARLVKSVQEYRSHLLNLSAHSPLRLVAHAYVRYLGDLSGGQILKKVLSRKYPDPDGLNFYAFQIQDISAMKDRYRNGLDTIGELNTFEIENICQEAILAFQFNAKVFESLDPVRERHTA